MNSTTSSSISHCHQCGTATQDSGETQGLCAACLLAEILLPTFRQGSWEAPGAAELAEMLPQYEIERFLGRGGMGAVYQGRQVELDRAVAIKILPADLDGEERDFTDRFKLEAKAMARLKHPGIVTVYDFGQTPAGLLYFVMELVAGMDVQAIITQEGQIQSVNAISIAAHVCEALHYAHSHGIIHRDIKPANVIVGYDGHVRVADFGLAKVLNVSQGSRLPLSDMVMGTPSYLAPESRIPGSNVDHRVDIYAVGVMLSHMLTGRVPQTNVIVGEKLPVSVNPEIDPRLERIIDRATSVNREDRYATAEDFHIDLAGILSGPVPESISVPGQGSALRETKLSEWRHPKKTAWEKAGLIFLSEAVIAAAFQLAIVFRPPSALDADPGLTDQLKKDASDLSSVEDVYDPTEMRRWQNDASVASRFIDVLAMLEQSSSTELGSWRLSSEGIAIGKCIGFGHLVTAYKPSSRSYEINAEFSTQQGGNVSLGLPSVGGLAFLSLASRPLGGFSGHSITAYDGISLSDEWWKIVNVGLARKTNERLVVGQIYHLRVIMSEAGVDIFLDDEPLISWRGDMSRIRTRPQFSHLPDDRLVLSSYGGELAFHKLTAREVATPDKTTGRKE